MKINFEEIPEEGTLDVDFLENESEINKLLDEGNDGDFSFNSPAKGSFRLSKRGKTVFVSLHIEGLVRARCSQCLVDFEQKIDLSNDVSLFPEEGKEETKELDLTNEELEKNFYAGNSIDLAKLLCEEIVLYLPFNPRCSDNCKGLCPSCGKNLNEGKCNCTGRSKENPFSVLKGLKF
ncbi:MAG: DUF177 domain-containing protein [Proteobacteria bacterium]|nr:DUF177 domain-containing protein [Pseudomonadota bacterium]